VPKIIQIIHINRGLLTLRALKVASVVLGRPLIFSVIVQYAVFSRTILLLEKLYFTLLLSFYIDFSSILLQTDFIYLLLCSFLVKVFISFSIFVY